MLSILSYDEAGLRAFLESWGQPAYRARQLCEWLWQRGASGYEEMTNLPAALRERLTAELPLQRALVAERLEASDGARKYLLQFADGVKIETVGIPDTGSDHRLTVCVSSQAGCALGCVFCATGRAGLIRNLGAGEIAEQVRIVAADFDRPATNVVVMGQGEPFANYGAVLGALRLLNSPRAFNIGARHITVSTSGIISGIKRLAEEPEQFRLALSLHAATQDLRDQLMPGLRKQPLDKLRMALAQYRERSGRRVSLEYVLLRDINDHDSDLQALADFARAIGAHVNLLPYNDTGASLPDTDAGARAPGDTALRAPAQFSASPRITQAAEFLRAAGIEATVRHPRGADIAAACGQLVSSSSSSDCN